jgi:hypothetical protein
MLSQWNFARVVEVHKSGSEIVEFGYQGTTCHVMLSSVRWAARYYSESISSLKTKVERMPTWLCSLRKTKYLNVLRDFREVRCKSATAVATVIDHDYLLVAAHATSRILGVISQEPTLRASSNHSPNGRVRRHDETQKKSACAFLPSLRKSGFCTNNNEH